MSGYYPVFAALVGGLLVLNFYLFGFFSDFELKIYDNRCKLRYHFEGPIQTGREVYLLVVGGSTLENLGLSIQEYPFVWSMIQPFLREHDVRGFVYDIIFIGPYDVGDANEPGKDWGMITTFQNVIGHKKDTFLASSFNLARESEFTEEELANWGDTQNIESVSREIFHSLKKKPLENGRPYEAKDLTVPTEFLQFSEGVGSISTPEDIDGVIRKIPLILKYNNNYYPSLHLQAACYYLGCDPSDCEVHWNEYVEIYNKEHELIRRIPIDDKGRMLINFVGKFAEKGVHPIPSIDVIRILKTISDPDGRESIDMKQFEDKLIVIGITAEGAGDLGPIPLAESYPLVGTIANAIQNIISNNFLKKTRPLTDVSFIFIGCILIGSMGLFLKRYVMVGAGILLMFLYSVLSYIALSKWNLFIEVFHVELTLLISLGLVILYQLIAEHRMKSYVQGLFRRYVPPTVVKDLIADPSKINLGGVKSEVTIMFTDISGFTSISERLQPAEIVDLLNFYFEDMVGIVHEYNGTLDKYIGDAMMVVFGAPIYFEDNALMAVRAGVKMQKRMEELSSVWEKEGKPVLSMRVGINTGEVVVGNIGASVRYDYTVIGDSVNLAQRLEANAPNGGVLISSATYKLVKDHVIVKEREPIRVKGKEKLVDIYEVIDLKV